MIAACIPVIPSVDIDKSLRFWVEGLGLTMDKEMRRDGRLIGCMVHNEQTYFWLNETETPAASKNGYEGISLYWTPSDLQKTREQLMKLGFEVSEIDVRDYGQSEFFVIDGDGYTHCFGVATNEQQQLQERS
ncbi:MAG TPA: VOC family protein [Chryseolinea sp.]|nr:VOC family protein [Chryseolinea sp.]